MNIGMVVEKQASESLIGKKELVIQIYNFET